MADQVIRFGVANDARTLKSSTWRCWTNGGDDKTVYLACRELGQVLHTSFHETGEWHSCFLAERFHGMFEPGAQPASRFTGQWMKPSEFAPGWTIGAFIYTAKEAVAGAITESAGKIIWVSPAPAGEMVEFCVLLAAPGTDRIGWPGQLRMNTNLVGSFEIDDGSRVVVVHRNVPTQKLEVPEIIEPRRFKGVTEDDLTAENLNAVFWGNLNGAVVFFDTLARLSRNVSGSDPPLMP
jgi:hypothetical protein